MAGYGLLHDIVEARHAGGLRVHLRFEDGTEGDVDLAAVCGDFPGVLRALRDPGFVAQVRADPESGTVSWPGEIDLDPVILYCAVRGIPVPTYAEQPAAPRRPARKARRTKGTARRPTGAGRKGGKGEGKRRATRR